MGRVIQNIVVATMLF